MRKLRGVVKWLVQVHSELLAASNIKTRQFSSKVCDTKHYVILSPKYQDHEFSKDESEGLTVIEVTVLLFLDFEKLIFNTYDQYTLDCRYFRKSALKENI